MRSALLTVAMLLLGIGRNQMSVILPQCMIVQRYHFRVGEVFQWYFKVQCGQYCTLDNRCFHLNSSIIFILNNSGIIIIINVL